jgi:hypothetical protein
MFEGIKYRWQLRKLENECSRIQGVYAKHSKGLSWEKQQDLRGEEGSEISPVLEEIDSLKSRRFCQIANRLMVPLPDMQDKEQWQEESYGQGRVLTSKGIWEVKKLIRQEKRERREGLVVWLAALTGIIGAITGLAAVLSR